MLNNLEHPKEQHWCDYSPNTNPLFAQPSTSSMKSCHGEVCHTPQSLPHTIHSGSKQLNSTLQGNIKEHSFLAILDDSFFEMKNFKIS
jgi:hypothetical protein